MAIRIQRQRSKGWKIPEGTVIVDRSTPWGNPFVVGIYGSPRDCVRAYKAMLRSGGTVVSDAPTREEQRNAYAYISDHVEELRGKNLACWCRLDHPCHADVLLEIANQPRCEEVSS